MKKLIVVLLIAVLSMTMVFAAAANEAQKETKSDTYPKGSILVWSTGQPQYRDMFYSQWLEEHRDIAPEVKSEYEIIANQAAGMQKIAAYEMAGDKDSMPEIIMLDPVGVLDLASQGLLQDLTDFYAPIADQFVEGAANDCTVNGRVYALPDSVRPQLLFYNADIFEQYDIDPAMMSTFDGYLEAGRLLKERSNGTVYLSYVDPGSNTWRYWGRRGLMPQANARIWDEDGNVVIGSDEGTKLALGFFDKLMQEGLLYKTTILKPPIYEATDEGKIATFYIGAFWDEFMRKNLTATAGSWRVMNAPIFPEIGTGGAPVTNTFCFVNTGSNEYTGLFEQIWYDFQCNTEKRNSWVAEVDKLNGPYSNPICKEVLADPFWQEPSDFYGGQSFRKAEADGLNNPSKNLRVTASDAEADIIISAEIEKYVAGEQTMEQAIANMDKELKLKIGVAK
ncbi:MAG: carbohydrate ABC transporter substrate-binding protein [Sphaerochaetaceae bacterium]|nr:carbohydrate ABC transporter substrate-binding protein [Sphaerochaetaceae bacterium]